jgi:hypothetical protein
MLNKRPLVCFTDTDGKYVVLGGNMRLKAAKDLGLKELPIILADEWTEEQKAEFLIKDNVGFGEWEWQQLANDWDNQKLEEWGLDVPDWHGKDDIDVDKFFIDSDKQVDSKFKIVLEYTEQEHAEVVEAFNRHTGSREQIVFKLLGL